MGLDKDKVLIPKLISVFSSFPPTSDIAATLLAQAYNEYAVQASACSAAAPTVVNLNGLIDGLKETLNTGGDYLDIAEPFADAFETYWTGALFGPTGSVVEISGTEWLCK